MSDQPVTTYTIGSHPLYLTPYNTHHLKIPSNGDDIRIIVSETNPTKSHTSDRRHFIQPNPTALTSMKAPDTIDESVDIPPFDNNDTSRDRSMDINNSFITDQKNPQQGSANGDRYIEIVI